MNKKSEKVLNKTRVAETLTTRAFAGGGAPSKLRIFRDIIFTVSTTSLWMFIAMNKQYMTGQTCQTRLLISPFDNRFSSAVGL